MSNGLAELELELRLLPGVVNVGFGPVEPAGHVAVSVVAFDPEPDLEVVATRVARTYRSSASVEILDLSPPQPAAPAPASAVLNSDERVALVDSTLDGSTGHAVVVLSWMGSSASGTGTAGALIGPAMATLEALDGLGITMTARLSSVSSGQGVPNPPVRVILRSEHDDSEFVGVARGATEPESAARATLAAFNRYVGGRKVQLN
jgi:hypothetical protein